MGMSGQQRLWERKDQQRLVIAGSVRGRNNRDVLFPVLALIRDRDGGRVVVHTRGPQFLAGSRIKRTESPIPCGANKDHTAGGNHWTAVTRGSNILLSRR